MRNFLRKTKTISCKNQYIVSRYLRSDESLPHEVKDFNVEKTPVTSLLWSQRDEILNSSKDNGIQSSLQKVTLEHETVEKLSSDSRILIYYNFSTDSNLRDRYINSSGGVLIGKIFEDLDALAGNVVIKHTSHQTNPYFRTLNFVTASVDKIKKSKIISVSDDMILAGQVAWVGRSSVDILMEIHKATEVKKYNSEMIPTLLDSQGDSSRLLSSLFTFVGKDPSGKPSLPINRLKPVTPGEITLFQEREAHAKLRKKTQREGLLCPSPTENSLIQSLVDRGMALEDMPALAHPNAVLMKYTGLENSLCIPPQNVNTAGRVFGGFLMHRAYDLALATIYNFSGVKPYLKEVDKIIFKKPVDIGDLVRFKSRVVFASDDPIAPVAQVEVTCQVVRPERSTSFYSNSFYFIFGFPGGATLKRVLPTTQEEAQALIKASKTTFDED